MAIVAPWILFFMVDAYCSHVLPRPFSQYIFWHEADNGLKVKILRISLSMHPCYALGISRSAEPMDKEKKADKGQLASWSLEFFGRWKEMKGHIDPKW